MPSPTPSPSPLRLFVLLLCSPFYVVYGLWLLVRAPFALVRAARGVGAAFSPTLVCSSGHRSPAVGRWRCAACGGVYHGWVGRCGVCGAGAGTASCETCGVTIRLPWVRR